jgi:hypothetical protein
VLKRGDKPSVYWKQVGEAPKRILLRSIGPIGDWHGWNAGHRDARFERRGKGRRAAHRIDAQPAKGQINLAGPAESRLHARCARQVVTLAGVEIWWRDADPKASGERPWGKLYLAEAVSLGLLDRSGTPEDRRAACRAR